MSTKEQQDGRVEQCRLVLRKLEDRLAKLTQQIEEYKEKTDRDDEIYVDLIARRYEVNACVADLRNALK